MLLVSDIPDNKIHGQARYQGGSDSAGAKETFRGVLTAEPGTREDYGEKRWRKMGTICRRTTGIIFNRICQPRPCASFRWEGHTMKNGGTMRNGDPGETGSGLTRSGRRTSAFPTSQAGAGIFRERNPRLTLTF